MNLKVYNETGGLVNTPVMCAIANPVIRVSTCCVCAIALVAMAGCSKELNVELPENETLKVAVYSGPNARKERLLTPSSREHERLAAWLEANRAGWSVTPASYVPGVFVIGKNFSINFLKETVIINVPEGQYMKSVDPRDYEFLLEDNRT